MSDLCGYGSGMTSPLSDHAENIVPFPSVPRSGGRDPVHPPGAEPAPAIYRPSVFYFRRELHVARTRGRAITVALIVHDEFLELRQWAADRDVIAVGEQFGASAACLRAALESSTSLGQAILLGLFLCHELEMLKAQVREAGLIPPKWIVLPEEAEEKGWDRASA